MEEIRDVIETDPSPVDEGVNEEVVSAEPQEDSPSQDIAESPIVQDDLEPLDKPDDREWMNVAKEKERKLEELTSSLPNMIEEAISKATSKKEEAPKYTVSQLEQYAIENPEYRPWVEEQKEILRTEQIAKTVESRLAAEKAQMAEQQTRNQAYGHVQSNYPELFVKDKAGNVRWDMNNPVVANIRGYLGDKRIGSQPDGIVVATKLAYADYYRNNATSLKTKAKLAESSLKKEQRKTMVSSSTAQVSDPSVYEQAMNRLRTKGDKNAARIAIKEILKNKGAIKE